MSDDQFKNVISHAKEYGYIFQSSEIYDGLSAVYDYGQNGALLKNNIKAYWWGAMVQMHENIVGIDSAIFMPHDFLITRASETARLIIMLAEWEFVTSFMTESNWEP